MNTHEMEKLIIMLMGAEIPFQMTIQPATKTRQVWYPSQAEQVCDVICHQWSYGHEEGLLEIMGLLTDEEAENDSVVGWLTAQEVFERISKDYWDKTRA